MKYPRILGLDIGGANLKAASPDGSALSQPFPLWRRPHDLAQELRTLFSAIGPLDRLAVTMTGELCDCFPTRRQGVAHILHSVELAFPETPAVFWSTAGRFLSVAETLQYPLQVAAANWHALAWHLGRQVPQGTALLLDIGSTTTDIIPLSAGRPFTLGLTDPERLAQGELVYTGVRRTPLTAIFGMELAAELFATTEDAYLLLGDLAEDPASSDTADGRPATRQHAHARIARMRCDDVEGCSHIEAEGIAHQVRDRQVRYLAEKVGSAVRRLPSPPEVVFVAGSGEFLGHQVLSSVLPEVRRVSLEKTWGPALSTAACAHAVACLLRDLS